MKLLLRFLTLPIAALVSVAYAQAASPVTLSTSGKLVYHATRRGDRIPDFSYAGYMGGGVPLPSVPVVRRVKPSGGDDTAAIQSAIDAVSALPLRGQFRGTVLLEPGTFQCGKTLRITASGVVLRGSGASASTLRLTGEPHLAISISGDRTEQVSGSPAYIAESYVPVGASSITVQDASNLHPGDRIRITRQVTPVWLKFMGMDQLSRNGKPETWVGSSLTTERTVIRVHGNTLDLDVPLTDSYDRNYLPPQGAEVQRIIASGEIEQSGVERLRIVAPARHVEMRGPLFGAINMRDLKDGWVRNVQVADTTGGISAGKGTRRITIEDVTFTHSESILGHAKPADFSAGGTQILFLRCASTGDSLFFVATGARNQGPNVVLDSTFHGDGHIQPHQRWSTAMLVDNTRVPDGGIDFMNRGEMGSGHGWTMAWGVVWNSTAKTFIIQNPPGAINWSIGSTGDEITAQMPNYPRTKLPDLPQGEIISPDKRVRPASLYREQLRERLGDSALQALNPI
ncbi:MAG: hypothetical protein WBD10_00705 [Acidobacteriaceae bacterium]